MAAAPRSRLVVEAAHFTTFASARGYNWKSLPRIRIFARYFKLAMRPSLSTLTIFFTVSAIGENLPRLDQLLPHPALPQGIPEVRPISPGAETSIIYPSHSPFTPSLQGHGILINYLGGRGFEQPLLTHYRQSSSSIEDLPATFIQRSGDSDLEFFLNERDSTGSSVLYTPVAIPIIGENTFGQRVKLAPPSPFLWLAIDLDGDHSEELLQFVPTDSQNGNLLIWDLGPNGNYISSSIPINNFAGGDEARAYDFDGDGDLDLALGSSTVTTRLLRRTGHRSFDPDSILTAFSSNGLEPQDLDGDGLPDTFGITGSEFFHEINRGDFTFSPGLPAQVVEGTFRSLSLIAVESEVSSPAIIRFGVSRESSFSILSLRFGRWEVVSDISLDTTQLPVDVTLDSILAYKAFASG